MKFAAKIIILSFIKDKIPNFLHFALYKRQEARGRRIVHVKYVRTFF